MSISFSLNMLQEYLNSQKVQESDKKTILDVFNNADTTDDYGQSIKDNQLTRDEVRCFIMAIMSSNPKLCKVIKPFIDGLEPENPIKSQSLTPEELDADRAELEKKIKDTYIQAQKNLLTKLSDKNLTFPHPTTGEKIPASNLLETLKKEIDFKPEVFGSAQAVDKIIRVNTTPSDGKNPPPLSSQWNCSVEDAMKNLLHEALHIEYGKQGANPGFNTQREELYVEENAILLLSQIADNKNTKIYGQTLSDLADDNELLSSTLQENFINKGYANRPKDFTGAVNIMGKELTPEDKVYIGGDFCGNVGAPPEGCLFDQVHENDIRVAGKIGGKIVLEKVTGSKKIEVKDVEGNIKFKAYYLPNTNFGV